MLSFQEALQLEALFFFLLAKPGRWNYGVRSWPLNPSYLTLNTFADHAVCDAPLPGLYLKNKLAVCERKHDNKAMPVVMCLFQLNECADVHLVCFYTSAIYENVCI